MDLLNLDIVAAQEWLKTRDWKDNESFADWKQRLNPEFLLLPKSLQLSIVFRLGEIWGEKNAEWNWNS